MSDEAIPAATLVVMRDRIGAPPELLMVERTRAMAFAAGAMVFPGGRIDAADWASGGSDLLAAAKAAAVRETLEETALPIAGETLVPFARWRPAFAHPRRFDTLFFLAPAPAGEWALQPQAGECEKAEWVSAAEMLDRIAAGNASAIFPTVRNLERLAQFGSFDEAARHAAAHPLEVITPWIEEHEGEKWLRIPDHLGYPVTRERLTSALRA